MLDTEAQPYRELGTGANIFIISVCFSVFKQRKTTEHPSSLFSHVK